jgi:hypothetical protein
VVGEGQETTVVGGEKGASLGDPTVDPSGKKDGAKIRYMQGMCVGDGVSEYIDAQGADAVDGDSFIFVSESDNASLAPEVNVIDEHVAVGPHDAGSARVGA